MTPFCGWKNTTDVPQQYGPCFRQSSLQIGNGANDPRVKHAESDQIVEAMRKNGKPVEYIVFPDEEHGFARPENRMKFYAAAED